MLYSKKGGQIKTLSWGGELVLIPSTSIYSDILLHYHYVYLLILACSSSPPLFELSSVSRASEDFLLHSVRGWLICHLQHLRHGPQQRCVASPDTAWRDDARSSTPALQLVTPHAFPHPQLTPAASAASTSSFTHTGAKIEFDPVEKGKGPGHQVKGSPMSKSANADAWRRTFEDSPGLVSSMWLKKVCSSAAHPIYIPPVQPISIHSSKASIHDRMDDETDLLLPSRSPVSFSLSPLSSPLRCLTMSTTRHIPASV